MAQPIVMPDLGSGMEEGTLLNWTKNVGEAINSGDVIAEIETDKTTVEVPVTISGTITQLIGDVGATLKVGAVIGYVGEAGEAAAPQTQTAVASNGTPAAPPSGNKNGGSAPAPEKKEAASATAETRPAPAPVDEGGVLPDGVRASPIARRIAGEKGIDLRQVKGTGDNGRITRADVENFIPPAAAAAPTGMISGASYGELPSGADVEVIETTKIRARIASQMLRSKQQVPHFYVSSVMDTDPLMAMRAQINAGLDDAHKVSVNDLVVKATALTLRQFPNLNSHFYGDKIVRHKRINIGIAVALPNGGLVNVVAKDADKNSISTIAALNKEMIGRARDGKMKPDDMTGSTFTVSNLGGFDVENFIAIINPPEAGILAVGTAQKVPVVLADGSLGVGSRLKVTLSADHRVSDGAEGAQFLQTFKKLMENPMGLLV
jgi:pyruvate dehydrogenase E2 component (dihydrolipoamide acetyltransferase)